VSSRTSPDEIAERYAALKEEVGSDVMVVVATKYLSVDELQLLLDARVDIVGENRAQDLEAKHARYGHAFRWHFIGHLQSRKAKIVNATCELCHSLDSASAAGKLTIPAFVEVNLSGEETKSGVAPEELGAFLELYADVRGLMTMPPPTGEHETSRPYFRLHELPAEHGLPGLSMGTSQDYRVAVEEGSTCIRVGSSLFGDRRPQ
jgi:PLP dependent protein